MEYIGTTFKNSREEIDGNSYHDCTFIRCRLVFSATAPVSITGCSFDNCDWVFDGAAELTLIYLSALYHGLGEHGPKLIDGLFESIRAGRPSNDITPAEPALTA